MSEKQKTLREFATEVIKNKGSIYLTVNGERKQFSMKNFGELPSDAELAIGNPVAEAQAEQDLDAEIKRLQGLKAKLDASKKAAASKEEEEEKPKVKKEEK